MGIESTRLVKLYWVFEKLKIEERVGSLGNQVQVVREGREVEDT